MKIFEVAGEGKLHGLTVMSLDAFVNKEDDVEESQVTEIDRRGFLKGLGAAAVAGATGGANASAQSDYENNITDKIKNIITANIKKNPVNLSNLQNDIIFKVEIKVSADGKILSRKTSVRGDFNQSPNKNEIRILNTVLINAIDEIQQLPRFTTSNMPQYYAFAFGFRAPRKTKESVEQGVAESLNERASQLLSAEDRNGVITVVVQAPDGTKRSLANDNPRYINQWLQMKYGLTLPRNIMDKFVESDMSGVMHAAKHYNKSFLITAELAEGGKKTFRVKAQSEQVAREKFEQHHNQATIISVKEEGVTEGLNETQFKSKDEAVKYAKERVKTFRDKEDGIEVWAMPNGSFDVNHTMNSSGRNHIIDNGGKKVGTVRP